jgi:hypothetical protein
MIIDKHAIARSHQRLRQTDWTLVQRELKTVGTLAAGVFIVATAIQLKQFAIPAMHGLFVGEVADDCLLAKTYLTAPLSKRWSSVLDAWIRFEQQGSQEWTDAIEAVALHHDSPQLNKPLAALAEQLLLFPFLRTPYQPGVDLVGEFWSAAREQASRSSDRTQA